MKVLHFLWSGEVGGAERAVFQLVARQSRDPNLQVGVLFGRGSGPYHRRIAELGVPVHALDLPGAGSPRTLTGGVPVMRRYDLHHFHALEPLAFAASLLAGRRTRVFTARAGVPSPPESGRKAARYRMGGLLLQRGFHGFSGNTRHATRAGAERFGIDPERFTTTYNGLDFSLLAANRTRSEVRRELGAGDGFVVGTAAILKWWKRVDRLLEAAAAARIEGLRVVVLGDGPELARLRARADDLGLTGRVHFAGRLEDVADAVSAMDAFVLPSNDRESFGNAVVEAMALGVPSAVFADSPGIVEHVDDGRTGFVVRDVPELTAVLERLAAHPGLRARIGAAGSDAVRSKYTLEAMSQAYAELYARASAHAGRTRAR